MEETEVGIWLELERFSSQLVWERCVPFCCLTHLRLSCISPNSHPQIPPLAALKP